LPVVEFHGLIDHVNGVDLMTAQRVYAPALRERAVTMYRDADPKPPFSVLGKRLGVNPETLRSWVRRDEADQGLRPEALATPEREELARLRRENRELSRANEILKAASAYFAVQLDQTGRRS
jgi:transposase